MHFLNSSDPKICKIGVDGRVEAFILKGVIGAIRNFSHPRLQISDRTWTKRRKAVGLENEAFCDQYDLVRLYCAAIYQLGEGDYQKLEKLYQENKFQLELGLDRLYREYFNQEAPEAFQPHACLGRDLPKEILRIAQREPSDDTLRKWSKELVRMFGESYRYSKRQFYTAEEVAGYVAYADWIDRQTKLQNKQKAEDRWNLNGRTREKTVAGMFL